jgi:hypothetical protein
MSGEEDPEMVNLWHSDQTQVEILYRLMQSEVNIAYGLEKTVDLLMYDVECGFDGGTPGDPDITCLPDESLEWLDYLPCVTDQHFKTLNKRWIKHRHTSSFYFELNFYNGSIWSIGSKTDLQTIKGDKLAKQLLDQGIRFIYTICEANYNFGPLMYVASKLKTTKEG